MPRPADRKIIGEDIKDVEFSWPIGMPLVRSLGNELWEVRSQLTSGRIARIIFTPEHGSMVLLQEVEKDSEERFGSRVEAEERKRYMKKENVGSSFDDFLREDGTYEEVTAAAIKRVIARQLEAAMREQGISKAQMARQMHTSRAALNRLLDPENVSVTLNTLQKAANVIGREVRLELV